MKPYDDTSGIPVSSFHAWFHFFHSLFRQSLNLSKGCLAGVAESFPNPPPDNWDYRQGNLLKRAQYFKVVGGTWRAVFMFDFLAWRKMTIIWNAIGWVWQVNWGNWDNGEKKSSCFLTSERAIFRYGFKQIKFLISILERDWIRNWNLICGSRDLYYAGSDLLVVHCESNLLVNLR